MNKLYLLLLSVLIFSNSFSQVAVTEVEPNNTFGTAQPLLDYYRSGWLEGQIDLSDSIDYIKLTIPESGTFHIDVYVVNQDASAKGLRIELFNSLQQQGVFYANDVGETTSIPAGDWRYGHYVFCGRAREEIYVAITANGNFDYEVSWWMEDTVITDLADNDTFATAEPFSLGIEKEGSLKYKYQDNNDVDTVDYFKSILPAANYDSISLFLKARNNSCDNGKWIQYFCYKNDNTVPFASGYVGNNASIDAGLDVSEVVPLSNMQEGDLLVVKFSANGAFGYSFKYNNIAFEDQEDNCCDYNAVPIAESETRQGNVGKYDPVSNVYEDEYDTYRIILPQDGAINVIVKSKLDACDVTEDYELWAELNNKDFNNLEYVTFFYHDSWTYGPPTCDSFRYDTIKIRALRADTFYLTLNAYSYRQNAKTSYEIKYQMVDVTNVGDAEPNDYSNALPIAEGETKKGHTKFRGTYWDYEDYYKAVFTKSLNLRVYVKGTYRYKSRSNSSSGQMELTVLPKSTSYAWPIAPSVNYVNADSIYLDTFDICGVDSGDVYFQLGGLIPNEYEFRYEILDTVNTYADDAEPNNNFIEASTINPSEVKQGRIDYRSYNFGSAHLNHDVYKTYLPENGTMAIYIEATNFNCNNPVNASWFRGFSKQKGSTAVFSKELRFTAGQTIYDTIYTCANALDSFYFRYEAFSSNTNLRYKLRYELLPPADTTIDFEPDNTFEQAPFVGQGQKREGFTGLKYNGITDGNDYHKIAISTPGLLTIYFKAENTTCIDNRIFGIWGYRNKVNSYSFLKRYVSNAVGTIDAKQIVEDTIEYEVPAGQDTIFLRIEGNAIFKYEFSIKPMAPTSSFSLTGDTTACIGPAYTYKAINVFNENVTYNWSLPQGGGTLTFVDSVATVFWNENANRKIQLNLSNQYGTSITKQLNVVVDGVAPTQVPVAYNFARTLSTNTLPPGAYAQWYRNDTLISGATDSVYYAQLAGSYTTKYINDCGPGPSSNSIVFEADALPQTITLNQVVDFAFSPTAKAFLSSTASSGLPVLYQMVSGNANILNDTLYVTSAGTVIVKAMQPGNDIYSPAPAKFDTVTVVKGSQVIAFDSIPTKMFSTGRLDLTASASSGLGVDYVIVSGNAAVITSRGFQTNSIRFTGAGVVTVRAVQNGNTSYNAATPVERTFCIGVRSLTSIAGDPNPCIATYKYTTQKIPGASYEWTLSGGGILTTNNDTAYIQWQTPGSYTLKVKANTTCDTVYSNEAEFSITTSDNSPAAVSGMLPADGAIDQQLPLKLSWIPGSNTVNYDLYIWESSATQPVTPYAANINTITYTIPKNSFAYNTTYKWRVVAKNPCTQTAGPIQTFRLIPLADLVVSDVLAPTSANSGQTVTISWKVTNVGPGRTLTTQSWKDGVFFSFDTTPNFRGQIGWDPTVWSSLTTERRPLLLGTKSNVSALDVGESYTNSISFKLPVNYSQPLYVYVMTNYPEGNNAPLQVTLLNDTARAPHTIDVALSPTPDLRIDSVFTPTTTFSGSTINLTYKVKNYGVVTPVGSVWYDSVFISQNPLFDRAQAIPLNFPLKYGQYYPNANDAVISNNTQLLPDSVYTRNTQVVVPNYIFGTWFIYVKANAKSTLYEGSLNNNNINRSQLEVYLTPTPKLQVNQLNVPVTSASTTQPIGINWNINNAGFNDNAERSKGHRFHDIGTCAYPVPCAKSSSSNRMATSTISSPKKGGISNSFAAASRVAGGCSVQGTWAQDSVTFGSSYWLDRVYISTDSTGLNINNAILVNESVHGIKNSGLFVELTLDEYLKSGSVNQYCFMPTNNLSGYDLNVKNVINPGSDFAKSAGFKIPSNLPEGNYFVYVHTNATKTVYEYPGSPQITRSAMPISVQRPDVTVSAISVPGNVSGGQSFIINYSLLNNGAGAVFNHVRRDKIYVSNFSSFDASAQLIETKTFTNDLPVGIAVPHTTTYKFPEATSGAKYFYVLANFDSAFLETNSNNNLSVSAGTLVSAAMPTDLTVSSIQLADTIFTIHPAYIKYSVPNNGTGTTNGTWTDSLFVSCSPTFNKATSFFVAKRVHNEVLLTGESYTDSFYFSIPQMSYEINSCFPKTSSTTAYFFIKTNADTSVYEGSDIHNNITGTGSRVLVNPLVDRIITSVTGADTVTVARPVTFRWTVKNIGYDPGRLYDGSHSGYYDAIYFSPDSVFNANAVLANSFLKYSAINRNDTARDTKSVITPNIVTGDYYVFVKTNSTERIRGEIALNNNTNLIRSEDGAVRKIHVIQPLLPDLVDSILTAPQSVAIGQPITVIHRVTNKGNGITYPTTWHHTLLLSSDFLAAPNDGDRLLNQKTRIGALLPGQSYDDTIRVTIPQSTASGNYILISRTNATGSVFESNSNNNLAFSLLNVYVPPPVDLIVENIMKPDTVMLGYTIDSVKWVIRNASAEEAKGISKDGIYLSKNEILDSTAVLIGLQDKILSMDALANDTLTTAPLVTNVVEGNYNLIIKTDLLNNIVEEDKDNNTGTASTPIYVKVKELPLNVVEANTLHKTGRFYKLLIPDTLLGSTIRVTLKSNDSLFVRNEMYVGGGYIPSGAKFDYKFEIPNYGNQQIVMTSVLDSVYYIAFNVVSPNPPVQNVTIKAEVLPFAILNVHTSSGGNIGNVTVKISGSLFRDSMTATLSKAGTTIHASAVYFTNSTTVYATFPLQGKPLGVYDISLTKVDSETTTLSNGFSVVPANNGGLITGGGLNKGAGNGSEPGCDPGAESGLNSQLVVDIVVPARALIRRPIVIQINYHNPTNFDIPAQSRVFYTEEGMKLSFTREGVPTGTTSMYLELTEPGAPPGIIRAGGSGTITLYSIMPSSVPVDPVILFKLK